ncbi:cytoskeleton protein RodZ [Pseudoalteromonas sp. BSi20652]|uniref:RodZ domain-containing protein n=1 Tax=Pseudoalteromonas sp. BSi20652 TaxID=388384 RepID=UPI000231A0EB|nr:RodZ domain-containing protein [Pseudoalteromonas sp. BSi20652]GAA60125.1 cytoskeleton protein RodZ [Pseudoalteromonas sp. BSi20652]
MNEENTQTQSEQPTVGQILKNHREQANVSIATIAAPLKLSELQIKRLENDEFTLLGPITFVKGYIKNYCRELKVDSAPILAMMPAPPEPAKPANMQSFSRRTEKEANDSRLMFFSYLILAIVIGSSALWFWQNATPIEEQTSNINVANSKMSERQAAQPSISEQQQQAEIDNESLLESRSTPSETSTNPEAVTETTPIASNNASQEDVSSTIVMNFTDESWVEIYDGEGEKIAFGVKKAGYIMTVSGTPPFSVVLGKHDAVDITLNGEPVDVSAFPKNRLAKFTLPLAE